MAISYISVVVPVSWIDYMYMCMYMCGCCIGYMCMCVDVCVMLANIRCVFFMR